MIDRIFISITAEIKKIITKISIRGLKSKIHHSDEFVVLIFYMKGVLSEGNRAFTQITREIHIIDNLKADMLIGSNILTSKRILINFAIQIIKIDSCRDITVSIDFRARLKSIKRTIKSSSRIILLSRTTISVSIAYIEELSTNRDFLFKLDCTLSLEHVDKVYTHIVNASLKAVHIRNDTDLSVIVSRKARLDMLEEYE